MLSQRRAVCYDPRYSGGLVVRPLAPILLRCCIGGLAVALLLAGCGRKGPLEEPPSARAAAPEGSAAARSSTPVMSREGYPVAPPGEKKRIPLDWLID
jgi:predicted small lipoprotein YifL